MRSPNNYFAATSQNVNFLSQAREKTQINPKQQQKAEELSGKQANELYRSSCVVIMDDEKYFTFSGQNMPVNAEYTKDKRKCLDDVRFAGKEKFPFKVLVWITISVRGMSKGLKRPSKSEAINSQIYFGATVASIHPEA